MAVVIESFSENSAVPGNSLVLDKPADLAVGDVLLIIVGNDDTTATDQWDDSTLKPTGFTLVNEAGSGTSDSHVAAFWKVADAGDVAATDFTVPAQSSQDFWGFCLRLSGVDVTDVINGVGSDIIDGTPPISITGFNTDVDGCLAFTVFCYDGGDGGTFSTASSGWTIIDQIQAGTGAGNAMGGYATKTVATAGATGTCAVSVTTSDGMGGFQFAINPSTGPAIISIDSDYGDASNEFDVDEDSLDINALNLDASGNEVYLSPNDTLAEAGEIDISAAINTESATLVNLDLTALTTELDAIEALLVASGHSLFVIVNTSTGETFLPVTVHRAKAFELSPSTFITASGENTTAQLEAPSGKTTGDFGGGRIQDDENPSDAVDLDDDEYGEWEWALAPTAGAVYGKTYEFRVLVDGVAPDVISAIPAITISVAPPSETELEVEQAVSVDSASEVALLVEPVLPAAEGEEEDEAQDVVLSSEPVFLAELAEEEDVASESFFSVEIALSAENSIEEDAALDVDLLTEPSLHAVLAEEEGSAQDSTFTTEPVFNAELASEVDQSFDAVSLPEVSFEIESAGEENLALESFFSVEPVFSIEDTAEEDTALDVELPVEPSFQAALAEEENQAQDSSLAPESVFNAELALEIDQASDTTSLPEVFLEVESAEEEDLALDSTFGADVVVEPEFFAELATEESEAFDASLSFEPRFEVEGITEEDLAVEPVLSSELVFAIELAEEENATLDVLLVLEEVFVADLATEEDEAFGSSANSEHIFNIEEAVEEDEAFDAIMGVVVGLAAESGEEEDEAFDALLLADVRFLVESAEEENAALDVSLAPEPLSNTEIALEEDQALEAVLSVEPVFLVELATEEDEALDAVFESIVAFYSNQAMEEDKAQETVLSVEPVFNAELSVEESDAQEAAFSPEPAFLVEGAAEIDAALDSLLLNVLETLFLAEVAQEFDEAMDARFGPLITELDGLRTYQDSARNIAVIDRAYSTTKRSTKPIGRSYVDE